jgi:hypothetical protein
MAFMKPAFMTSGWKANDDVGIEAFVSGVMLKCTSWLMVVNRGMRKCLDQA